MKWLIWIALFSSSFASARFPEEVLGFYCAGACRQINKKPDLKNAVGYFAATVAAAQFQVADTLSENGDSRFPLCSYGWTQLGCEAVYVGDAQVTCKSGCANEPGNYVKMESATGRNELEAFLNSIHNVTFHYQCIFGIRKVECN